MAFRNVNPTCPKPILATRVLTLTRIQVRVGEHGGTAPGRPISRPGTNLSRVSPLARLAWDDRR